MGVWECGGGFAGESGVGGIAMVKKVARTIGLVLFLALALLEVWALIFDKWGMRDAAVAVWQRYRPGTALGAALVILGVIWYLVYAKRYKEERDEKGEDPDMQHRAWLKEERDLQKQIDRNRKRHGLR